MEYVDNLLMGLAFSAAIGLAAWRRGSLAPSGAVGAMIVGTTIFGLGGWVWGMTLIAFFFSSTALSRHRESVKASLAEKFAKGHRRDFAQTLANGGAGAALAVAHALWSEPIFFASFLGAIAAVNADTWATELGVLNPTPPRLITNGRIVEIGTSGAVSRLGLVASAAGALVIGLVATLLAIIDGLTSAGDDLGSYVWAIPTVVVSGLVGSLVDSLLGASVQGIYFCPRCAKETEKRLHGCGTMTQHRRGWRWLNNDMVNFLSSLMGAVSAAATFLLL